MDGDETITGCGFIVHPHEPDARVWIDANVVDFEVGQRLRYVRR